MEQGRVGIIDHLHQRLNQLVSRAYGWRDDLTDSQIVERLISQNQAWADTEAQGEVQFLRPLYQAGRFERKRPDRRSPSCRSRRKRHCCPRSQAL